ncbi:cyclic nucleotide-binding domain-containing protein [Stieleria varia]|uniref:cAMP-activated global transcriptional regulator CRP n=1 Tax=Stieleria varia TaxID=2528005 RepID=A0A5C6AW36_9BACT|nr:cyclic nucleotide-binding domain-containing protein [Stieleria varia]TWU04235.1 cAMP-activated global transcriptional regulator CRP [Stieleria varia]
MTVMASQQRLELLRAMPIFGGVSPAALSFILNHSDENHHPRDSYFFCEGDKGDCVYVLQSGTALVERRWEDMPIILGRLRQGDCFGEMSLVDLQKRAASIRAESDCQAIRIPFRAFRLLCNQDMQQYTMVMMNLGREISRRLRVAGDRLFRFQQELGRQWFDDELTGDN